MSENKTAKTPTDSGTGFIDGVWYGPGPTYISSKPAKQWIGLTDEEIYEYADKYLYQHGSNYGIKAFGKAIEAKLKEKNT